MKAGNRNIILIHILGWILFFIIPILAFPIPKNVFNDDLIKIFTLTFIINNLILVVFFYINTQILIPKFLFKNHTIVYVLLLIIGAVIYASTNFFEFQYIFKTYFPNQQNIIKYRAKESLLSKVAIPLFFYCIIIIIGILTALINERQRHNEEKKLIELGKTSAELEVLKLQISPHFLFNTLNNIRWLARQKSDQTEDAVVKLSSLLRYILYQTKNETVSLKKEIQNLVDFISLHKMRLNDKTQVIFEHNSDFLDTKIEPLLFIPFIENVFKYGISNTEPSTIEIKLNVINNELLFYTKNTIFEQEYAQDDQNKGLGIKNVKQRLELSYPNAHELTLTQHDATYEVLLKLKLHHV